jgi:hypothetical protein
MKQARIGFAGYCPPSKYDKEKALEYICEAFNQIEIDFPDQEKILVSGLSDVETLSMAYNEASRRGWKTAAVTSEKVMESYSDQLYPVDEEPIIIGNEWGAESPVFTDGISKILEVDKNKVNQYKAHPHYGLDTLIRIGLGPQSIAEATRIRKLGKPTYEFDLPRLE